MTMDIIEANNHAFLVALVKKQAAQLEAAKLLADDWCDGPEGITADARYFRQSLGLKLRAALEAS